MLDDLRNTATSNAEEEISSYEEDRKRAQKRKRSVPETRIFGMTAAQRFVLILLVLLMTCVLGIFFLVFTGSVYLPFF
ncbi:hypothetical protein ADN00_16900 [Ornatilinea apprima]|uniref:Uncharacterized protein n=1 Tax=Ornatilinea apprima TaxID=1134406 RepID=A0A0P6XQ00_9CHLR|nr:hypothetical protein [Ornatilinea apprima]KPL71381.1 hypothetical protein ADN00_16900 [Ornatilinea apprima]